MVRRLCLDLREARPSGATADDPALLPQPGGADETKRFLTTLAVREAIARLSETDQIILRLKYQQGMSYQQIAEIVHIPVGTLASRLHRAKEQLRRELGELL